MSISSSISDSVLIFASCKKKTKENHEWYLYIQVKVKSFPKS